MTTTATATQDDDMVSNLLRAYPEPSVARAPTSATNRRFPLRAGYCHITQDA